MESEQDVKTQSVDLIGFIMNCLRLVSMDPIIEFSVRFLQPCVIQVPSALDFALNYPFVHACRSDTVHMRDLDYARLQEGHIKSACPLWV